MLKINPQATPELLRRARAEWSIENLELKANQTQVGFQGDCQRRSALLTQQYNCLKPIKVLFER